MKTLALLLAILALSGCMTTSHFVGPDGQPGHITKCNGTARSMADCYNRANEVCEGRGYNVIQGDQSTCGAMRSGQMITFAACRELTYTCK